MEHFKITETELWAYISKTADDETIGAVEKWMASSSFDEALFKQVTTIYKQTKEEEVVIELAKDKFFNTVTPARKLVAWKSLLKYAAVLLAFISGTYFYHSITTSNNLIIVQTTFGEQKQIELVDGSLVWLNASSKLSYNSKTPRTLYLEGEGFFEVAKDKEHPFTVTTLDDITVEALGTSFNIKAYENSPFFETKLLTGKVQVTSVDKFKNNMLMTPNEKVFFVKKTKQIKKTKIDFNESKIVWKEGKIQFRNKTFTAIANDLKTQFDIQINFKNEIIANTKFTGTFEKTTPIAEIFEILKISKNFDYKLNTATNEWMIK